MTEPQRPRPAKPPAKPAKPDREAMVAALSALSVNATSPDGVVSLSVNTDGVMTRLHLSDGAAKLSPAQLADLVHRTYLQAQHASAAQTAKIMRPLGNAGYLTERLKWRLTFQPPAASPATPAAGRATPPKQADEGAVLRDRTGERAKPGARTEPESDEEFYGKGVALDDAW